MKPPIWRSGFFGVWLLENLADDHRGPILAHSTHLVSLEGGIFADDATPDH
jgi:hypothetical protein